MGKKTNFVKKTFKAIKTKFDYATCAGSEFEKKVKDSLDTLNIEDKYKKCAETHHWSPDNLRFNGEATDDAITITISAPAPNTTPPPDLIKSVIKEAKEALKSYAKKNNYSISQYNWKDPTTTVTANEIKKNIEINIMGSEKTKKEN